MRPTASSSQCSSTATPIPAAPGLVLRSPAGVDFSSGFCVSMGNEILADRVLLSDIASNALGELNSGSPSFLSLCQPAAERIHFRCPAPKGASDVENFAASLKRCPDTNHAGAAVARFFRR